jgi:hypothetical protein
MNKKSVGTAVKTIGFPLWRVCLQSAGRSGKPGQIMLHQSDGRRLPGVR